MKRLIRFLLVLTMLAGTIGALLEFFSGLQSGKSEMTALFPRTGGVPRHMYFSFLCAYKDEGDLPIFPGVGFFGFVAKLTFSK